MARRLAARRNAAGAGGGGRRRDCGGRNRQSDGRPRDRGAGGAERCTLALSRGAEAAIDYKREDLREAVKKLTGGAGVDVVFDPVGGDISDAALRCLGWEGRLVVVGFASGRIPAIPANLLLIKNVAAIGLFWGAYRARNPDKLAASLDALLSWWDQGALKPFVSERYPLARAGEALERLAKRQARGKIAIEIG